MKYENQKNISFQIVAASLVAFAILFCIDNPLQAQTFTGNVFSLLHSFNCATDGCYPVGAAITDKSGNVYGTANYGGPLGYGTVWKIIP